MIYPNSVSVAFPDATLETSSSRAPLGDRISEESLQSETRSLQQRSVRGQNRVTLRGRYRIGDLVGDVVDDVDADVDFALSDVERREQTQRLRTTAEGQ